MLEWLLFCAYLSPQRYVENHGSVYCPAEVPNLCSLQMFEIRRKVDDTLM